MREPIPTWYFALVVVRLGRRFLVVHERKHGQLWYFPGGRVEPGEDIFEAARREAREEAGLPVVLEGILRIEHSPHPSGSARCRVFFVARPEGDTPPKATPDEESLEAAWVTLEELEALPLRDEEVREVFRAVAAGAPIYPLGLLSQEGAPWRLP